MALSEFQQTIARHLRSGAQILYICSAEPARLVAELKEVQHVVSTEANDVGMPIPDSVITLQPGVGFSECSISDKVRELAARADSLPLLINMLADNPPLTAPALDPTLQGLIVLLDADDYFQAMPALRTAITVGSDMLRFRTPVIYRPLVIVSRVQPSHVKTSGAYVVIDHPLPSPADLADMIDRTIASANGARSPRDTTTAVQQRIAARAAATNPTATPQRPRYTCADDVKWKIVNILRGMTEREAENGLAFAMTLKESVFGERVLAELRKYKGQLFRNTTGLTVISEEQLPDRAQIGGFDLLLAAAEKWKTAFTPAARAAHIDCPKGIVLLGAPGTGKSYVAAALSKILGLQPFNLDFGSLFGSLVGESEQKLRMALRQIDAQESSLVLVDEGDKVFSGVNQSQGDSGTSKRMFGSFLSWLARQHSAFVVMTMNRTDDIPEELLRAGRFSSLWYTDVLSPKERRSIIQIHLERRHVPASDIPWTDAEWQRLMSKTEIFSGAELEALVVEARAAAFSDRGAVIPAMSDMLAAADFIVPTNTVESMDKFRKMCAKRARPVSSTHQISADTHTGRGFQTITPSEN